jgi:hypothetical protein
MKQMMGLRAYLYIARPPKQLSSFTRSRSRDLSRYMPLSMMRCTFRLESFRATMHAEMLM